MDGATRVARDLCGRLGHHAGGEESLYLVGQAGNGDGGVEIGQDVASQLALSDRAVEIGEDFGRQHGGGDGTRKRSGVEIGQYSGSKHVLGDGSGFDYARLVSLGRPPRDFGGKGVGGRRYGLIRQQVLPFLCVGSVKADYKKKLWMVEKEIWRQSVHALPAK